MNEQEFKQWIAFIAWVPYFLGKAETIFLSNNKDNSNTYC